MNEGLDKSHTIIWNGPMGVFEFDEFQETQLGSNQELD